MKPNRLLTTGLAVASSLWLFSCNGSTNDVKKDTGQKNSEETGKTGQGTPGPGSDSNVAAKTGGEAEPKGSSFKADSPDGSSGTASSPIGGVPTLSGRETKTDTGLQYLDLALGEGPSPQRGQKAVIHTKGWLSTGEQFEDTVAKGESFEFPVGAGWVIPGFEEAIASMKVGGKRRIFLTPELGYRQRGNAAQGVPPNASTIWEIELVELR